MTEGRFHGQAAPGLAGVLPMDVGDEDSVEAGFRRVREESGRPGIMVNCAGVPGPTDVDILACGTEDFDEVLRVNPRDAFPSTRAAIALMLPRGYGRLLQLTSTGGEEGNPGMVAYAASKAGLTGLVKMGRLGTVAEVAALSCWIVSHEASFNTDCVFDPSDGRATW